MKVEIYSRHLIFQHYNFIKFHEEPNYRAVLEHEMLSMDKRQNFVGEPFARCWLSRNFLYATEE